MKNQPNQPRNYESNTKDIIRKLIDLWETKSTRDIAEELGVELGRVSYLATQIRKEGYDLPRKYIRGVTRKLIKEVLAERSVKRR